MPTELINLWPIGLVILVFFVAYKNRDWLQEISIEYLGFKTAVKTHGAQRSETDPKITISDRRAEGSRIYADIKNVGTEDIEQLGVEIRWKNETEISRPGTQFFRNGANPIFQSGEIIKYISVGELLTLASVPNTTDDGRVEIIVRGQGVSSGKIFETIARFHVAVDTSKIR